ncbi:MAG TPA: AI-2E family transporter [Tepiditoga sp.]|nr:AI-2E family transporter [Tepiditoga sp.]
MSQLKKSVVFSAVYLCIFFMIPLISMQVFSIMVFSLGILFVVELFSILLTKFFKIPKKISIMISIIILFASVVFLMFFLIPTIIGEVSNFMNFLNNFFKNKDWEVLFNNNFPEIEENMSNFIESLEPKIMEFLNGMLVQIPGYGQKIGSFLFYVALITIYGSFYMDNFKRGVEKLFPKSVRAVSVKFVADLYKDLKHFVVTTLFAALFVGIAAFFAMNFLGIRYTILLAFWAALTNFIPVVGVIFEFIPLILVGISAGITKMLILLIIMSIIHFSAFIFFLFVLKGKSSINPVAIIISILVFGYIFGTIGPLIAVPIGITIKVFWTYYITPMLERG